MGKVIKKKDRGMLLQLFAVRLGEQQEGVADCPANMEALLHQYSDLFEEPMGLPLPRMHDHRIPLAAHSQPVNVRPYRCPHYQKNEIDKIVADLLGQGVIRPSVSPYSSSVLLVKKTGWLVENVCRL